LTFGFFFERSSQLALNHLQVSLQIKNLSVIKEKGSKESTSWLEIQT